MKTAKKILIKKKFIKDEMDRKFSKPISDELWEKARARLDSILKQYESIPTGEHTHTDNYIFPAAAIYLTLKEENSSDTAYAVIENAAIRNSSDKASETPFLACSAALAVLAPPFEPLSMSRLEVAPNSAEWPIPCFCSPCCSVWEAL